MSEPAAPEAHEMVIPPWLVAGAPREPMRETLARAKWALGSYWLFLASSYAVLLATAAVYWHGDGVSVGAMIASSAVGVAAGNLLALARARPWIVQTVVHVTLVGALFSMAGGVPPMVALMAVSFLWSVGCGHFTLQRRSALATLWIPMVCWTAAIVTILQHDGRMNAWQSGRKDGIWQPVTMLLLFLVIAEFFVFLAGQEHYHAQVWQAGATTTPFTLKAHRDAGATRLTKRGVTAVLAFAVVASLLVGRVAPYLFRTEAREGHAARPRERPAPDDRPREVPDPDWEALKRSVLRALREARRQAGEVLPFVPLFLLNRPLRRLVLLRHLRRPAYEVTPTQRATNLWRYVLIALGDVDLAPRTGESLDHAIERAITVRTARAEPPPEGLAETGETYQRIRFGLGIPTGALESLQASAERAFGAVRAPLGRWRRVKSWWRKIEA